MQFVEQLTRNEMKNIMAGEAVPGVEGDCQWNGCGTAGSYYTCLTSKCFDWYSGNEQTKCAKTVQRAHKNMIAECDLEYQ